MATLGAPAPFRERQGEEGISYAGDGVAIALANWTFQTPLYAVYTAKYGRYVHWGARGRPGRPWVALAAQQFPRIVREVAAEAKARGGRP